MRIFYGIIAILLSTAVFAEAGTVYKTIIKNGTGPIPQTNQTVIVHYTGKLQSGEEFDSSRSRNEPFKFKLGAGEVIRGWDAGVSSMSVGERAELEIAPEDGYGAEGYPPTIPPSAKLLFDIELLAIEGVTPVPPLPAFGGMTDILTSSSASSQLGSGQSTGFGSSNMFDSQGFSSTGISLDGNQGFSGIGGESSQSFTPPDLSMSGPRMRTGGGGASGASSTSGFGLDMTETSRPRDSVPSLADAFSVSMSGRGSAGSLPEQRSVASMDGPFDFGRRGTGDALFGSQGSSQRSGTDSFSTGGSSDTSLGFGGGRFDRPVSDRRENQGTSSGSRFPETRFPGMDINSASGTDFGFDRSAGGTGFSLSEHGGGSSPSTGRNDLGLSSDFSSRRFGSEIPSQTGGDTMLPGMDIGFGSSFSPSSSSAGARDLGSGIASDTFGSSTRGFSRDRPFDMDRGTFREDTRSTMSGSMSTARDMGMGSAGSEMSGGMGLGMGGRMTSFPGIGSEFGMSGSGSDRRGLGMSGRTPSMSDMAGGVGSGMGMGAPGSDMSGRMGSSFGERTQTFGGGTGIGASGPGMTGGMGPGMDGRMSSMSGMRGGMGSRGSEPDIGGRMPSVGGMGGSMGGSMGTRRSEMTGGMDSAMRGRMTPMGGMRGGMEMTGSGPGMTGGVGTGMAGRMSPMGGMGGGMEMTGSGSGMTGGVGTGMAGRMSPMGGMRGGMEMTGSGPGMTGGVGTGMAGRMSPMGGMRGGMEMTGSGSGMAGGMGQGMAGRMSPMGGMRGGVEMTGSRPGMTGGMGPGMAGRMPPMSGMESGVGAAGPDMPGGMGFMGRPRGGPGFDRSSPLGTGGVPPFMGGPGPRMGPGGPGMGPGGPGMGPGAGPMPRVPGMRPGSGPFSGPMGPGMMPPFMRRRMPPFMRRDAMRRRMMGFRRRR